MDSSGTIIRPITPADAEGFRHALGIVAREGIYLRLTDAPTPAAAAAFVGNNIASGNPQLVAEHAGTIIGWCDIVRQTQQAERHCGSLGMGLVPGWREQGIGAKLLAASLAAADAQGFVRIELTVNAGNERAIRLYRSQGFEQEGRLRAARLLQGRFGDVLLMARLRLP